MTNQDILLNLRQDWIFFFEIDSDGCALDTMEIKQKECFCPNFIRFWSVQSVAKVARQTWEFVNLYSRHRSTNKFLEVIETIQLLAGHKEVKARYFRMPVISALILWIRNKRHPGNPSLTAYATEVNDPEIDQLIRKYGYHGTPTTLEAVNCHEELRNNLSAAAHVIHGSSEGRFRITYCPGHPTRGEVERVGFEFGDIGSMLNQYKPEGLHEGLNRNQFGEEFYYISNPATGLWMGNKYGLFSVTNP